MGWIMGVNWDKKLFRLSENDMKRLDHLVSSLEEEVKSQGIRNLNRTILIRALIMMSSDRPKIKPLVEYIKMAHVYL